MKHFVNFLVRTLGNDRGEVGEGEDEPLSVDDIFKDLDKIEEPEPDDTEDPKPDTTAIDNLQKELDELKSERHGLLQATKAERNKRQDIEQRLNSLSTTVGSVLQQRQAGETGDLNNMGVPVEFSEDGDEAYIASDKLNNLLNPIYKKVSQLETVLKQTSMEADGQRKAQDTIDAIVGSDERYGQVYNKYKPAREWINNKVIEYQKNNNISGTITSGQALDNIIDSNMEEAFVKKFPEFDITDVVTAGDSKRHFTAMLGKTASKFDDVVNEVKTKDNKFQKIINKPSGLGNSTNAKANELSVTEKLGNISAQSLMDMTDEQAAQLEKAMLEDEKSSGVVF